MGQKVNPNGIRLGIVKEANARWYPPKGTKYADLLLSDIKIREHVRKALPVAAAISKIFIERTGKQNVKLTIHTAKPGVIIGKKGEDIEKLRLALAAKFGGNFQIGISEIRKPEMDAKLVAEGIASQLERRVQFKRAMKRAVSTSLRQGAKGVKIMVAGRLGGAEIARTEWHREGRVPLHTFRADIDYATAEAKTTYGIIGVKVWIFKSEVLAKRKAQQVESETA
jgi:small subunit ribosomal protein S3